MGCCCSKPLDKGKGKAEGIVLEKRIPYDPSSDSDVMPAKEYWPAAGEAGPSDWRDRRRQGKRQVIDQANRAIDRRNRDLLGRNTDSSY
ncbi:hypothetical protein MCOR25_010089 [Pyricularia grisea]|uniref:Uncharacterized protein n=1 Tax=Pyricularia grisea TaxID=148305 RepID=A0A6P8B9L0_PYRGI|nr:uncharacterized protein PgNI_02968 [Pyricularia grisea]KAI6351183.1 hypothetical protein MCOR25_010089 [Pyricularia grisea]TLD12533.1 hypothetical protein PgNI_02968 [Pyricularia grisea]